MDQKKMPENKNKLKSEEVNYCQQASAAFWEEIEEDFGDWRVTRARLALKTGQDPDSRSPMQIGQVTESQNHKD